MTTLLSGCQNLPDYHVHPKTAAPVVRPKPVIREVPSMVTANAGTGTPATSQPQASLPSSPMIMKPVSPHSQPVRKLADGRDMPAVQGLLAAADARLQQGDLEEAANSLERAQRLAPQSASIYLKLAETRMRQNRVVEAEQLARKGLAFSQATAQQAALWRLVATAAERQGKMDAASQARQKAEQLEAAGDRS